MMMMNNYCEYDDHFV